MIYINDLIRSILRLLDDDLPKIDSEDLHEHKVSEVLNKLESFNMQYIEKNEFPDLKTSFDLNLFNTFRSYIDIKSVYPKKHILNSDYRGFFIELLRSGSKGQSSYSITKPQ